MTGYVGCSSGNLVVVEVAGSTKTLLDGVFAPAFSDIAAEKIFIVV